MSEHNKFDYTFHKKRDYTYYVTYLKRFKRNPSSILEFGCGVGLFLEACQKNKVFALGLEYEQEGVDQAISKGLTAVQHDLGKPIDFIDDESYDAIFSNQVIEHLVPQAQENMIKEAFRILRSGGQLQINSPCRHYEPARKDKYHIGLLTPSELRSLCEKHGFINCVLDYNRPQKIDPVPEKIINEIWDKYMPDIFSQTASIMCEKP